MDNAIFFEQLPLVLRVKDLQAILHVSSNTVYKIIRSGAIHSIRVGRNYLIPRDAVADYLSRS